MRNKATKKNMDLDLRRYGNKLYSKAEQSGGSGGGSDEGGDSTPTEFYIKFRADDFGVRDKSYYPDTLDRTKGYRLDEILDMSDNTVENIINNAESNIEQYLQSYDISEALEKFGYIYGIWNEDSGNSIENESFKYFSYESGEYSYYRDGGCFPVIYLGFIKQKSDYTYEQGTLLEVKGTNFRGWSWDPLTITFEKHKDDGLWYIVYAY